MSNIVDYILAEVCLDERVKDGIFKLDEEAHMEALRDHLVKKLGLSLEEATAVTNRMLEGRFPERQAYRAEDGILVTWPSPKHKAKAMAENPGKYVEEDEAIKRGIIQKPKEPRPEPEQKPEPKAEPAPEPAPAPETPEAPPVDQIGKELAVEPPRGDEKPQSPPGPPEAPSTQPVPKTPEEKDAEKTVVKQMMNTDDTALTSMQYPPISENCKSQLSMIWELIDKNKFPEANEFLKKLIS